jgi:hypothetical protein
MEEPVQAEQPVEEEFDREAAYKRFEELLMQSQLNIRNGDKVGAHCRLFAKHIASQSAGSAPPPRVDCC